MPDHLRITVDEVRKRMGAGEQFAFIDTRNPQAWADRMLSCPGRSAFLWTSSKSTSRKFPKIDLWLRTAPDQTKVLAPVWRKNFGSAGTRMFGRFRADWMRGVMRDYG
jgi:hypothetical protein